MSQANAAAIVPRVFAATRAAWLGVSFPSVPSGQALFPFLTTGTAASALAKGEAAEAAAAVFTVASVAPRRIQARYLIGREDLALFAQAEQSLVGDLRAVLGQRLDEQIINGDNAAPNFDGILRQLDNPAVAPSVVATWLDFVNAVADGVDGKFAGEVSDVKLLLGVEAYRYALKLTGVTSNQSQATPQSPVLRFITQIYEAGVAASAAVPAPDAANIQPSIRVAANAARFAIAPIWEGFELVRDPFTGAAKGQVAFDAFLLGNFAMAQTSGWGQPDFKLGA